MSAALGHPRVFLRIDPEVGFVECGYCDRRFVLEGGRRGHRLGMSVDPRRFLYRHGLLDPDEAQRLAARTSSACDDGELYPPISASARRSASTTAG